ncbi:MAG: rhomboid family intramembrane serine protease [Gemmataceae bacterium]
MPDSPSVDGLTEILQAISQADPPPWRPSEYVARTGTDRSVVDEGLNRLRLGGLVQLTDWEAGKGQGYVITMEGRRALAGEARVTVNPRPAPPPRRREWLRPNDETLITRILIALQATVFAFGLYQALQLNRSMAQYLNDGRAPVQNWFFVSRDTVRAGEWWRLWTHALVHGGILHLALNLYAHHLDASLAERMWRRWRFAAIYFTAVLGSGLAVVLLSDRGAVGSSGGWCGVVAAQFIWFLTQRHHFSVAERMRWTQHYSQVAILLAVMSFAIPNVSWEGHLGGAIGGAIGAGFAYLTLAKAWPVKVLGWSAFVALPVATVLALPALLRSWF